MKGAIIGDIIGKRFEWHNIKTKEFALFVPGVSDFTDDSVLTLATAEALMRVRPDALAEEYREKFVTEYVWFAQNYPHRGYGGSFAGWIYSDKHEPYYSCGNGSAMRVSPVAWVARSLEECELLAKYSAEVTHNHPDGIAGAQATAGACWLALHGATKRKIREYVERYYTIDFKLDDIRDEYYYGHFQGLNAGTVPYAVEAFLESTGFEDCIRNTISIGGDSDTLAAISGAIAEAYYGVPDEIWDKAKHYLDTESRNRIRRFYDYANHLTGGTEAQEADRISAFVSTLSPIGAERLRRLLNEKFPISEKS